MSTAQPGFTGLRIDLPADVVPRVDEVDIADFSYSPKPIRFRADDDVFTGKPVISLATMQQLAGVVRAGVLDESNLTPDSVNAETVKLVIDRIAGLFDMLLESESANVMRSRLREDEGYRALDIRRQVIPALHYVLERHGLRPTRPSSDFSAGSPSVSAGTSSTAGAPAPGSDPSTSNLTGF